MKIGKFFVLFSCILAFGMLFSAAGATPSAAKPELAPDGIPAALTAFEGLYRDWADPFLSDDSQVSDVSGDVGLTRYIQAANRSMAMYTKAGDLIASYNFDGFWYEAGTGTACDGTGNWYTTGHHGQPNVLYDHMAQRWLLMDLAYADVDNGPYYLCIAVSNYAVGEAPPNFDPANWLFYALPAQNQWPYYLPNQARIGLWPDGYYIAADLYDMYNNGLSHTAEGAQVWAVNRDDLVNNITPFRAKSFYMTEEDYSYHGLLPSNLEGEETPPTGTPNFFVGIAPPNQFLVWEFSVDWTNPDASTFPFEPTILTTAEPFDWVVGYLADQYGTTEMLDLHSDRLSSVTYRIIDGVEALWASHTVMQDMVDDLRWYELRDLSGTPYFYQQGSFAPDSNFRWVSSLGVDAAGNMAIGYSISGAYWYPSVYYTGRLRGDPLGTLLQGEQSLVDGTGYQDMNPLTDEGPWGERSAMSIDPVDPCVFWYTNQFYVADQPTNWHTVIGAFRYPSCMQGTTARVSLHTNDSEGNGASGVDFEGYSVDISNDGRYVVFSSEATDLVDDDNLPINHRDIFVRDRDADGDGVFDEPGSVLTTLISRGLDGRPANSDSWQVAISGNGRYIAFSSYASNLVEKDTNGTFDVFRYDQDTGAIVRISVSSAGVQGNAVSDQPSISYGGRYVAFRSYANNLIPDDTNDPSDIFVRDVSNSITSLVSINASLEQGNDESFDPSISDDGRWVAYASRADNLYPGDPNGVSDVFAYDRYYGDVLLVSAVDGTADAFGDGESYAPSISADGSRIAFVSRADNLIPNFILINDTADIFVRKPAVLATRLISLSFFGAPANADSYTPAISPDGNFVAYASDASTLGLYPDMNGERDIFLFDLDTGFNRLISRAYNGNASNGRSVAPEIADQGSQVAYPSFATNLVPNDTNNKWDVFAYNRHGVIPNFLTIPSHITAYTGEPVSVPVLFDSHGQSVDTITFSVDFDETCLIFDEVTFTLPGTAAGGYTYDASDTNGELDFDIQPENTPSVPLEDGQLALIDFIVDTSCQADPDGTLTAPVGFSIDPRASFGINGQSIPGTTTDGSVVILGGYLGDCNSDGAVDAGDLGALVLEIFDGDGNVPANVPMSTFVGNPIGCNPNQDLVVDAGDISCEVMLIFDPTAACANKASSLNGESFVSISSATTGASLSIAADVFGPARSQVTLPITLVSNGNLLNSMVFSVDYDRTWLTFDPLDGDLDGIPDAVTLNLPDGFQTGVWIGDGGQINFFSYTTVDGLTLPDGVIGTVTLTVGQPDETSLSPVFYSSEPPVSLGDISGQSAPVTPQDGSVWTFWWASRNLLPFLVTAP